MMTRGHGTGQKIHMGNTKNQMTFCKLLSHRVWQHHLHRFAAQASAQQGNYQLHRQRTSDPKSLFLWSHDNYT